MRFFVVHCSIVASHLGAASVKRLSDAEIHCEQGACVVVQEWLARTAMR